MTPELSRWVAVSRVPTGGMTEQIVATDREREALARRFGLAAIRELNGLLRLEPWRRGGVKVIGRVNARIVQACVVTLDLFEAAVQEEVARYFVGQNMPGPAASVHSVEALDEDAPDIVTGDHIDLGEVMAETLGLAIDPYPRKPGAVFESAAQSRPWWRYQHQPICRPGQDQDSRQLSQRPRMTHLGSPPLLRDFDSQARLESLKSSCGMKFAWLRHLESRLTQWAATRGRPW